MNEKLKDDIAHGRVKPKTVGQRVREYDQQIENMNLSSKPSPWMKFTTSEGMSALKGARDDIKTHPDKRAKVMDLDKFLNIGKSHRKNQQ